MKEVLSAIGRFLATLVISLLLITGGRFLLGTIPVWSGAVQAGMPLVTTIAVNSLLDTWLPVILASVLLWLFGLLHRPRHHLLIRSLVFVIASGIFLAGGVLVGMLAESAESPAYGVRMEPRQYYNTGDGFVFFGEREGLQYRNGVRVDLEAAPRMTAVTSSRQVPTAGNLTIPATAEQIPLSDFRHTFWTETAPPRGFEGFFRSTAGLSREWAAAAAPGDLRYLLFGLVLMAMASSAWSIARLSRWPLLNAILTAFLLVGLIALLDFGVNVIAPELVGDLLSPELSAYIPHALVGVFFLVFLVINLFQPPFREWQRNVKGS